MPVRTDGNCMWKELALAWSFSLYPTGGNEKKVWKGRCFWVPDTLRQRFQRFPLSLWLSVMIDLSVVPPRSKLWNRYLWFRLSTTAAHPPSGSLAPPQALMQESWLMGILFFWLRDQKNVDVQMRLHNLLSLILCEELMALLRPISAAKDMGRKPKWCGNLNSLAMHVQVQRRGEKRS